LQFVAVPKVMSKYRSTIFFKDVIMGLLLIYLFYALANLFLIPSYSTSISNASFPSHVGIRRQTINVNHDNLGYVRLGDKSIIDDDQLSKNKSFPVCFRLVFDRSSFFRLKTSPTFAQKVIFHNSQHSYLSFCILRI
jgi:hypothetical protein